MALTGAVFAGSALVTHFVVRPGRLGASEQALMPMQRMGPPRDLQDAYEELNAGTAAIRAPRTGRVISTGVFAGKLQAGPSPGGVSSLFPGSVRRLLQTVKGPSYAAIFVTALSRVSRGSVVVDMGGGPWVPGTVMATDPSLGLAAVRATPDRDQLLHLGGPPVFLTAPAGGTWPLRRLILRRNPGLHHRSAGFVITSGALRAAGGGSWCGTPVAGTDAGAPLGWVSAQGTLVLAGLARPSDVAGRCGVVPSWTVDEFLRRLAAVLNGPAGTGAYLGVTTESTTAARHDVGYRGTAQGAYVLSVDPDGPAARAGVRAGDVITGIGGYPVSPGEALSASIRKLRPGTPCTVTVVRGTRIRTVRVTLARLPYLTGGD